MRPSLNGCWTCKLRHRKCDLRSPECKECNHRGIPCHGYGPKPAWMDGSAEERRELTRIKATVRQYLRTIRRAKNDGPQPASQASPATRTIAQTPPSPPHREHAPARSVCDGPGHSRDSEPVQDENGHDHQSPAQSETITPTNSFTPQHPPSSCIARPESASLLMHYLDHVFYWQYPYFRPCSRLGNRGWLLSVLHNSGPLYHAALALSALHQDATQTASRLDHLRNQQAFEYHSQALRKLGEFSRQTEIGTLVGNKSQLAEFVASSLMLISFEVFNGAKYDWLPHLDAMTTVLSMYPPADEVSYPTSSATPAMEQSSTRSDLASDKSQPELDFLVANAIWFDILACVSTDRVPRISYRQWLEASTLDVADLMGCQNWVMISIGDLAHLQAWKADMKAKETLSMTDLVMKSRDIETRLQDGIAGLESVIEEGLEATQATWISHIFALASLVLLGTIVSGPWASLPEIRGPVEKAVDVLCAWPRAISLQGIVWPLYVIGCMAESKRQAFFESILVNFVRGCGGFGNGETVLKMMKEFWEMPKHREVESVDLAFWTGTRVLLI